MSFRILGCEIFVFRTLELTATPTNLAIFDNTCDPVSLRDLNVNCMMFADDLVLLSTSASVRQRYLDKLLIYTKKKGILW